MSHQVTYPSFDGFKTERAFTDVRAWCRNPEYWHAADPDSTEFEVLELVAAFVRAVQPEVVVETGSAFGFGSEAIGRALQANGHGRLYSLEIVPERAAIARERCAGLPVDIIEDNSTLWDPPEGVGVAFFDSYPELRPVEFRRYRPKMVPGAVALFHDAGPHHQVWAHVAQLEEEGLLKAFRIQNPRGLAVGQVVL